MFFLATAIILPFFPQIKNIPIDEKQYSNNHNIAGVELIKRKNIVAVDVFVPINKKLYTCVPPTHKEFKMGNQTIIQDTGEICTYNTHINMYGCRLGSNYHKDGFCITHRLINA